MTFYFVRHGETYFNYYGRVQGWADAPLTKAGSENVIQSGIGISDVKFDAIYTSDLTRTIKTMNLLLSQNKATPKETQRIAMPEFREVFFGSLEGMKGSEVWAAVAEEMGYESSKELFKQTNVAQRMDGARKADPYGDAEDFLTFWHRIEKGLLKLVDKHRDTGDTVLLVAHGGTIRYMLENLIPDLVDPDALLNASVTVAKYANGQFHLERYNDVSHFGVDPALQEKTE